MSAVPLYDYDAGAAAAALYLQLRNAAKNAPEREKKVLLPLLTATLELHQAVLNQDYKQIQFGLNNLVLAVEECRSL